MNTTLQKQAASGVKWTTLSTVVTTGLQILQLIVLSRLLKPEDFGLMAMVGIVIGFAQTYADLGISAAIIHKQDTTREHLSSLYWLNIICGVFIFFLLCAIAPMIAMFFKEPCLIKLINTLSLSFLIIPIGAQFQVLLQKNLRFNLLARQEIIAAFFSVVIAILTAFYGQGVWALVWGQLTGAIIRTIQLTKIGWKEYRPTRHFDRNDLRGYFSFGLYQMGERSINYFNFKIDQLLIGYLLGTKALGYYNFAFNLVIQPTMTINPILTKVAFPIFSLIQNNSYRLRIGYLKVINVLCTINAPLLFGISIVAPLAVPIFFGEQWIPAISLVQLLSIFSFIRSTGNPIGSLLLAKGRADIGFAWNLVMLFITAPVIYVGAKVNGLIGVALALICLHIILYFPCYLFIMKPLIGPCAKQYFKAIIKPFAFAMIMCIVIWMFSLLDLFSTVLLLIEIVIGVVTYISLLWLLDKKIFNEIRTVLIDK